MKRLIQLSFLVIMTVSCTMYSDQDDSDISPDVKGPVASVEEKYYTIQDTTGASKLILRRLFTFDRKGRFLTGKDFRSDFITPDSAVSDRYDRRGRLVQRSTSYRSGADSDVFIYQYKGRQCVRKLFNYGHQTMRTEVLKERTSSKDTVTEIWEIRNMKHLVSVKVVRTPLSETQTRYLDGKPKISIVKIFDQDGNVIDTRSFMADTLLHEDVRYYEDGNLIHSTLITPQENPVSFEYEYSGFDRYGNWLKKTTRSHDSDLSFIIRTIFYYN